MKSHLQWLYNETTIMLLNKTLTCALLLAFLLISCFINIEPLWAASTSDNTWETKAPIPSVGAFRAVTVNGKIYVMGGSLNYEYNSQTDNWTAKAPMPTPRNSFGIVAYNDKVYTFGGYRSIETEVYDPATDTWESKTPMPTMGINSQASVIDDQVYVMAMNGSYCYNIANDSWSTKSNAPNGGPEIAFDGRIYAFADKETRIYNPENDSWGYGAPMPLIRYSPSVCATTGIMSPKRIFLFGGEQQTFDIGTNVTQIYNPKTNTWMLGEPMPTERYAAAVAVVEDRFYVIGGATGFYWNTDANQQYTPLGYGTPDITYQTKEPEPSSTIVIPDQEISFSFTIAVILLLVVVTMVSLFVYYKRKKS